MCVRGGGGGITGLANAHRNAIIALRGPKEKQEKHVPGVFSEGHGSRVCRGKQCPTRRPHTHHPSTRVCHGGTRACRCQGVWHAHCARTHRCGSVWCVKNSGADAHRCVEACGPVGSVRPCARDMVRGGTGSRGGGGGGGKTVTLSHTYPAVSQAAQVPNVGLVQ